MRKISRRGFLKGAVVAATLPLALNAADKQNDTLKFIHVTDSHMDLSNPDSVEAVEIMRYIEISKNNITEKLIYTA